MTYPPTSNGSGMDVASRAIGHIGVEPAATAAVAPLSPRRFRLIVAAVMLAAAVALTLTSLLDYDAYVVAMRWLSVEVKQGRAIDWRYVADTVRCWQQGSDVWHGNACDVLRRPMDYSPVLLRLGFLATGPAATMVVAALVGATFCAALLALPVARSAWGQLVMAAAILSPASVFMVERANIDALIVAGLVLAGGLAWRGGAARWLAHGVIVLAALVKFYPAAGMVLVLRERRWRSIATIVLAYAAGLGGAFIALRGEVAMAIANVPHGLYFENGLFGAAILPNAVAVMVEHLTTHTAAIGELNGGYRQLALCLRVASVALMLGVALRGAWRAPAPALPLAESRSAVLFLLAGTVLLGCFLAGISIQYRATMATLLLPLLIRVSDGDDPVLRRVARGAALIVPVLLWISSVELVLLLPTSADTGVRLAVWLARELMWWAAMVRIATVLAWLALDRLRDIGVRFRPSVSG